MNNTSDNYIEVNKTSWNNKVDYHLKSAFYDLPGFLNGETSLKSIELDLLGDVKGKTILHLQCHFGQDSISLSRMGAKVTGIDLSDKAILAAQDLAKQTNCDTEFICCNIYDLPQHLNKQFDMVFTSYGVIGWLPDLDKWAQLASTFLKPGGRFVLAEFHPVVWMFDNDFDKVGYNYFNSGAILETTPGTYADQSAPISQEYITWNHGIAEVLTALIRSGLTITAFNEFDYSPYNCFTAQMNEFEAGKFRVKHLDNKIPMVFSLSATK